VKAPLNPHAYLVIFTLIGVWKSFVEEMVNANLMDSGLKPISATLCSGILPA
jgi:hypothetical protein